MNFVCKVTQFRLNMVTGSTSILRKENDFIKISSLALFISLLKTIRYLFKINIYFLRFPPFGFIM